MLLALISTQRTWGGGENVLAQLATGASRAGHRVAVAAPAGSPLAAWAAERPGIGIHEMAGRGRGPLALWRLRRWVLATGAQAVLLNDPHAVTYAGAALAGTGVPRVAVKHTAFPVRSGWKYTRLVERVVCVAEAARRECLAAGVPGDRLEVIHAGLDRLAPSAEEVDAARRLFDQDTNGLKNVLAVGNLLAVKGLDTLIDAAAVSRGWRLWIAGEGPEREALEAQIKRLGLADRVTLLGFRRDIGALLAASDAFASASHREGLSLVLVEAMMAGVAVIATPVGGNGEVLRIDRPGVSDVARAVAPSDPAALAMAIEAALEPSTDNDDRVAAAKAWAESHFTVERMTRDYLALFDRLTMPAKLSGAA